jgi:hypothetical protein
MDTTRSFSNALLETRKYMTINRTDMKDACGPSLLVEKFITEEHDNSGTRQLL